jgi:hypothetical protein
MKGIVLLALIGSMPWLSFADDARELPKGMLRLSQTTSFAFAVSEFNLDGSKQEIALNDGRLLSLNIGAALELGITSWVSAVLEWAPGWTVWSAFDFQTAPDDMLTVSGGYDLFAATRVQVLGRGGLLPSERFRLAIAPGGRIPLPSPDWLEQANRALDGEHWRQYANDYHTPGLGSRAWFDVILTHWLFLNLYAELIRYFPKDYDEADLLAYQQSPPKPKEVDYGYSLTAEVEPHIGFPLSERVRLEAGLPVTFRRKPELRFDGTAVVDSDTYLLTASPRLTLLLSRPAMEFRLGYTYPILGRGNPANTYSPAMNALSLQVRSYLRIYR